MNAPRRYFWYWCSTCPSTLQLETAVTVEHERDASLDISCVPEPPKCPMCARYMEDWDDLAPRDPTGALYAKDGESSADRWGRYMRWFEKRHAPASTQTPEPK